MGTVVSFKLGKKNRNDQNGKAGASFSISEGRGVVLFEFPGGGEEKKIR